MNLIMIVHLLAALFTVAFAVYTGFHVLHKSSMQHRISKMSQKMAPMIVSRIPKQKIVEKMSKEGFPEHESSELHDKLAVNFSPKKPQ